MFILNTNSYIMSSDEKTFSVRLRELLDSTNTLPEVAMNCLSEMCEGVCYDC